MGKKSSLIGIRVGVSQFHTASHNTESDIERPPAPFILPNN